MLDLHVKYAKPRFAYAVLMETLGDRIKMLRIAKGLSQSELAQQVGVTKSAVCQWELSQTANVKLATFLRLCEALGVRPEYLIFGPGKAGEKRTALSGGSAKS
jgi:transcriptional regulator with XRE-family HTH domain